MNFITGIDNPAVNMKALSIREGDLQRIYDHCSGEYPNEACGILAGTAHRVEKVFSMKNARPGPAYFEMDPSEQFQVMKEIRQAGLEMVSLYHSHPSGPAHPSSLDLETAYWPGTALLNHPAVLYVIISLLDRVRPEARVFTIMNHTAVESRIQVIPEGTR